MSFSISLRWLSSVHESREVRETGAELKIALGQDVLTRNIDEWSRTVSDDVRVSAYPLALWFASNWWRLRWEPLPNERPPLSWRMSHEIAAAGYGYIWPQVAMASDGESIQIWSVSSPEGNTGPVQYLSSASGAVAASNFEYVLDQFFDSVLARLNAVGIRDTELHALLAELSEERGDTELATYRRLEAMAGFDAGEGPAGVLDQLEALIPEAGPDAAQEIATLGALPHSEHAIGEAVRMAGSVGLRAAPDAMVDDVARSRPDPKAPAWIRGRALADRLRERLGLNGHPVSDEQLFDVMGVASHDIERNEGDTRARLGLAIRQPTGQLSLHLRRRRPESVRFELARFLCDHVLAGPADRWLPATDAKTSRQKVQRAFAAEFLCPIGGLTHYLNGDFSDDAMEDAAHHFRVSPWAIQTQLLNNGFVSHELQADIDGGARFPYAIA